MHSLLDNVLTFTSVVLFSSAILYYELVYSNHSNNVELSLSCVSRPQKLRVFLPSKIAQKHKINNKKQN